MRNFKRLWEHYVMKLPIYYGVHTDGFLQMQIKCHHPPGRKNRRSFTATITALTKQSNQEAAA